MMLAIEITGCILTSIVRFKPTVTFICDYNINTHSFPIIIVTVIQSISAENLYIYYPIALKVCCLHVQQT